MEQNNKLLKSSPNNPNSSNNPMMDEEEETGGEDAQQPEPEEDRISELPKEVLHHILSFLAMKEVIETTTLLSTKWPNLWKSLPFLTFDLPLSGRQVGNNEKSLNFIDNVLRLRNASTVNLQRFCLDSFGFCDPNRVNQCMVTAVNQGAREIHVSGWSKASTKLNPCIFTELSVFKFSECNLRRYIVQLPTSILCAKKLKYLELMGIGLPEGDSNGEVHFVCPLLEHLVIKECYHTDIRLLGIACSRLKKLVIEHNRVNCGIEECKLEIRTPNLTSFQYKGLVIYADCFVVNSPFLVDAFLPLEMLIRSVKEAPANGNKFLRGLCGVRYLRLEVSFLVVSILVLLVLIRIWIQP